MKALLWRWLEWLGRNGEYGWLVREAEREAADERWARALAEWLAEGRRLADERERAFLAGVDERQAFFEVALRGMLELGFCPFRRERDGAPCLEAVGHDGPHIAAATDDPYAGVWLR